MGRPLYIINAFTRESFGGNPAAVMPLDAWLPDATLQRFAAQHNLSETAFFVELETGCYELRWFTPGAEVELCGHATLATAHALRTIHGYPAASVAFETRFSGELVARYIDDAIELDFPSLDPEPMTVEPALQELLGMPVVAAAIPRHNPWKALYELESEAAVRAVSFDFTALAKAVPHGVIVTARGEKHDFVSRFFAPQFRIDEDPVTGSAHSVLTPYWADKLGKQQLRAAQLSERGGELTCTLAGDRVRMLGHCVTYALGEILI